jgi:hypothetical protein
MSSDRIEVLGKSPFYERALELLLSLLETSNPPLAERIAAYSTSEVESFSLWELGFDSALMIELVLLVDELGVFLPDELPWATLTLADVYSIYTTELISGNLKDANDLT